LEGDTIVIPMFSWQPVSGAAKCQVELSRSISFTAVTQAYTTFNTRLTPSTALANNAAGWYWRVTGLDASNHPGLNSVTWSFTKDIPAPALLGPAGGSSVMEPALAWTAADGAARYLANSAWRPSLPRGFIPIRRTTPALRQRQAWRRTRIIGG
jgi:hypothetical protein